MNLFDIKGKKAIVTGGTRGLGFDIAKGFLKSGAEVCIIGSKSSSVEKSISELSGDVKGVAADLGIRDEVYERFSKALQLLGGDVDILVNCHGIQRRHPSEEFPLSDWDEVINVNLNSVFILCQEASKVMIPKKYGKIINIASMVSWFGGMTVPAYTAAKGGVTQLTKALSNDWIKYGINVNAIAPGYMATEMNKALLDPKNPRYQQITDRIPAKRWGTGEDMVGTCVFLSSEASDYLGGAIIPVDGGYLVS